jgi:hypothetical protein
MDIASIFDWFACESMRGAEQTDDPKQREIFLKLAEKWASAAQNRHAPDPLRDPPT